MDYIAITGISQAESINTLNYKVVIVKTAYTTINIDMSNLIIGSYILEIDRLVYDYHSSIQPVDVVCPSLLHYLSLV